MPPHAVSGDTAGFIHSLDDKDPDLIYSEELNALEKVMANEQKISSVEKYLYVAQSAQGNILKIITIHFWNIF